MTFQCIIVTPEQQVLDQPIIQAILPAHDGLLGVLTGRAPMLVKLGIGPLRIDLAENKSRWFFIDEGIAQMKQDVLTIITSKATAAEEIDAQAAQAEYAEAAARKATAPADAEQRNRQMLKARVKQEVAGRK